VSGRRSGGGTGGQGPPRSARWLAGLAGAIVLGALAGYLLSPGAPEVPEPPGAGTARVAAPVRAAAPEVAPEAPLAPPADLHPESPRPATPPPIKADLPFLRTAPGDEPEIQGDPKLERKVREKRIDDWTELMARTRPEVRGQILEGKKQERERLALQLQRVEDSLAASPDNAETREARSRLKNDLYYLDEAIERLQGLQENGR
jgi:hypothetical protein